MGESVNVGIHLLVADFCTDAVAVYIFHKLILEQDL